VAQVVQLLFPNASLNTIRLRGRHICTFISDEIPLNSFNTNFFCFGLFVDRRSLSSIKGSTARLFNES
jgi:NADH:ubiquinone oxidoreductase subunit K